jgi:hypothetical protein
MDDIDPWGSVTKKLLPFIMGIIEENVIRIGLKSANLILGHNHVEAYLRNNRHPAGTRKSKKIHHSARP